MEKLRSKYLLFMSATLAAAISNWANATSEVIYVEPFYQRYERAAVIVMGEIAGISETTESVIPDEFRSLKRDEIKVLELKVSKSWKGEAKANVRFVAYTPKRFPSDDDAREKMSGPYKVGRHFLVFLRTSGGINVAQNKFGFEGYATKEDLLATGTVKALDALTAGGSMDVATKLIGTIESSWYQKSKKKNP